MDINIIYYNILYHMTHLQQETSFTSTVQEPKKVGLFVRADEKLIKKLKETLVYSISSSLPAMVILATAVLSTNHGDTSYSGTEY